MSVFNNASNDAEQEPEAPMAKGPDDLARSADQGETDAPNERAPEQSPVNASGLTQALTLILQALTIEPRADGAFYVKFNELVARVCDFLAGRQPDPRLLAPAGAPVTLHDDLISRISDALQRAFMGLGAVSSRPVILFQDVAAKWKEYKRHELKPSTLSQYFSLLKNHILPYFRDTAIDAVDAEMVSSFLVELKESGRKSDKSPLSAKTVSSVKDILKSILEFAQERGMIVAVPVFPTVSVMPKPVEVLSHEEQYKLTQQIIKERGPFATIIAIIFCLGLRNGEGCALRWGDIDLVDKTIRIYQTANRVPTFGTESDPKTKVEISTPKTPNSYRIVPIPEHLVPLLQKEKQADDCFVATGTTQFLEPQSLRNGFYALMDRADLDHVHVHTLRHTAASNFNELGMDPKTMSEILGHSSPQITMNVYVHPSMKTKRDQLNKLDSLAFKALNEEDEKDEAQTEEEAEAETEEEEKTTS